MDDYIVDDREDITKDIEFIRSLTDEEYEEYLKKQKENEN